MSSANSMDIRPGEVKATFSVTRRIRFGQTDPAGIVYYPNYFDMFNEIVEDWFADELEMSFRELHQQACLGVPIVQVECRFHKPCRLGDVLTLKLKVVEVRNVVVAPSNNWYGAWRVEYRGEHGAGLRES